MQDPDPLEQLLWGITGERIKYRSLKPEGDSLQESPVEKSVELRFKDEQIAIYQQHNSDLTEIAKLAASQPVNVEATAVADNSTGKNDLRGAQFAGGYAEIVQGNMEGGIINNYGPRAEDITRLLTTLRDQAKTFPDDQKDETLDIIDDLEGDLVKPKPDQARIVRRLKKLAAIATALTIGTTGFAADLAQLAEALNVPIPKIQVEQVQPDQLPPSTP